MTYQHLSVEEREEIQEGLWKKEPIRSIARHLGCSPSSISREIAKNQPLQRKYFPRLANERALIKRKERGRKLRLKNQTVRRYVIGKLKKGHSPEQIAGCILREIGETVSYEAIYQYTHANGRQWVRESRVARDGDGDRRTNIFCSSLSLVGEGNE